MGRDGVDGGCVKVSYCIRDWIGIGVDYGKFKALSNFTCVDEFVTLGNTFRHRFSLVIVPNSLYLVNFC